MPSLGVLRAAPLGLSQWNSLWGLDRNFRSGHPYSSAAAIAAQSASRLLCARVDVREGWMRGYCSSPGVESSGGVLALVFSGGIAQDL